MAGVLFERTGDGLRSAAMADLAPVQVCEEIIRSFHAVAAFQWCAVMTTDPETFLPSGGVVEGFRADDCVPFWDNELVDADFSKFTDLARSVDPVASLADIVDGDLERSPRYRNLYRPLGAGDELRTVFMSGTSCLAVGVFLRPHDLGPFRAAEVEAVRSLVTLAATALRRALGRIQYDASMQPPVVIMLDAEGHVTGMSAGGQDVLDDLRVNGVDGDFPGIVQVAAAKARFSRTATNLTTRLRGRSGRWLRLHVSPMEGSSGVVLTVETARPDDLVRVLLESYGLTPRETDIVLQLCRGLSTKDIAAELILSSHTVRDHLKAIYEKAGVTSRGELVAALFSNHVLDRFHSTVQHVECAS